jgi:hypothetical protein
MADVLRGAQGGGGGGGGGVEPQNCWCLAPQSPDWGHKSHRSLTCTYVIQQFRTKRRKTPSAAQTLIFTHVHPARGIRRQNERGPRVSKMPKQGEAAMTRDSLPSPPPCQNTEARLLVCTDVLRSMQYMQSPAL